MDLKANLISKNTELVMHICKEYINKDTIAVDATLGKGFDTIHLLKNGARTIYAFDIQEDAILQARENINNFLSTQNSSELMENIHLIKDCHTHINNYLNEIDIAIFNLGYLPNGDKSITTANTSLLAIQNCLKILKKGGLCCISLYHGHNEGKAERKEILKFAKELDNKKFHALHTQAVNQWNSPPELLMITRKG